MPPRRRRASFAAVTLAALPLAACSVTPSSSGSAQDGRAGADRGGLVGSEMMRGGAGGWPSGCPRPTVTGTRVDVVVADMRRPRVMDGFGPAGHRMMLRALPATVPHGPVTFVVRNHGRRLHELVVLPLTSGSSAGARRVGADGRISEAGALGEASSSCGSGAGEGIRPGSAGWVTLELPAGRYELVCNLRHHYADGMRQELDVT